MDATKDEDAANEREAVGALDRSGTVARYVISDPEANDAWLSIAEPEAPVLREWR